MDPAAALQTAENALRLIVREVLGDAWQASVGDVGKLEEKRNEERKRRDGAVVAEDLLAYTEFHELKKIIIDRWDPDFHAVFDNKARTKLWIEALEDVRNAIAHSRPLLQFERDLAAGVSGQLRNQITIYRTSKETANQHYPVIESVRDPFGQPSIPPKTYFGDRTLLRLDVGDVLSFDCTGSDQRGRDLEWALYGSTNGQDEKEIASAQGTSAVLSWTVTEDFVGESKLFHVRLRAAGARHFRHKNFFPEALYDDEASFAYAINPPYD